MPFSATVIYVHLTIQNCTLLHFLPCYHSKQVPEEGLLMNYELCTMLTFFRVKSFPILFISTMFVVFTSAAYNHHKLSVCPVCLQCMCVLSPFKSYQPICLFAFVMVLYCILPLRAFILFMPAEVGFMHMCNTLYLHCLSKEPDWSISRRQWMLCSRREPNQKRAVHLVFSCNGIICPPLSLTFILYLQHNSVLWSLKMPLSRFPQGNDSGLR